MEYNIAYVERLQLPSDLYGRLTSAHWEIICSEINGAEAMGTSLACAGELCCCLFTGFFPIFCFHPCISPIFTRCARDKACLNLNLKLFNGRNVVFPTMIGFGINYHELPVQVYDYAQPAHPNALAVATAVPVTNSSYFPPDNKATYSEETKAAEGLSTTEGQTSGSSKFMKVTIPDDALPGVTIIDCTLPDGSLKQVTVPANSLPGSTIQIPY